MRKFSIILLGLILFNACSSSSEQENSKEVNIYSHRHYDVDKEIYAQFEKETGIKVNVIEDDADKLMVRIKNEGQASPCDLLITADAGRLLKADAEGLFAPIKSQVLNENIPANFRDENGKWYGLTMRARVIVYHKERIQLDSLNYEDLALPQWKGKLLMRSSENVYNQSLVASMIAHHGYDSTLKWAQALVLNFARDPKGGDRDQILAIAAGEGDITVANTYYIGKMKTSSNEEEVKAVEQIALLFPNQANRGTHVNISGAGMIKTAPNKANAQLLLEFLSSEKIQKQYAEGNLEYPVNPKVEIPNLLKDWGIFKQDVLPLSNLSKFQQDAIKLSVAAGWK